MEDQDISVTDKIIENIDEDKVEASVEPAASVVESEPKVVNQRARPPKTAGLYNQAIISQAVQLEIREVGRNLVGVLLTKLRTTIEGTCIAEGFVKPSSIVLLTYSSGIASGARILFNVVFQCLICHPVEGMLIRGCVVKNITKAGIRATTNEARSPVVVFVSRDHQSESNVFEETSVGDSITVKVAGQRYELMDTNISVVGTIVGGGRKPIVRIP